MIRHLHPTDSPALLPFKQRSGSDEVFSLARALKGSGRGFPLFKYTSIALSPRAWQSCWVKTRRGTVQSVLRAGPRSGGQAWDVSELYLASNSRDVAMEVLEQLAFPAGSSGARRIFLNLPHNSDLFNAARAAGYLPAYSETVYRVDSSSDALSGLSEHSQGLELRPVQQDDLNSLYRLYCACVPIHVRTTTGQTLDEWRSSRQKPGRKWQDWGIFGAGSERMLAHVATSEVSGGRYFSLQALPDSGLGIESLIAAGIGGAGKRPAFTNVASYDLKIVTALERLGFTASSTYDVMVKTLAVPAKRRVPGLAYLER